MSILTQLKHPNIVVYEGNLLARGILYLIFGILEMDLKTHIDGIPSGQFMDREYSRLTKRSIMKALDTRTRKYVASKE
jgi:hypothetical protein